MIRDPERLRALAEAIRESSSLVMVCDTDFRCPGWEEGMRQINDALNFCEDIFDAPKYRGPVIKFCPWCGKEIIKREESCR